MRLFPVGLFVLAAGAASTVQGCGNPINDDSRADRRLFLPAGVIQGTVTYQGPHPCSQNGHIIGGAVVLVFDARNPPPPKGLATSAVNFGVIAGDALFANEPRNPGPDVYCPKDHGITDTILASGTYSIAPMEAGVYVEQAFYDYTGDFFPLLNVKRLPEFGDILGGYIDVIDAAKHPGDANYLPKYLPITVGVPDPTQPGNPLAIPNNGYVAENVAVSIAVAAPFPRPYFYPSNVESPENAAAMDMDGNSLGYLGGSELPNLPTGPKADYTDFADTSAKPGSKPHTGTKEMAPNYIPVITMTQDHMVYAKPKNQVSQPNVDAFQASFKQVRVNAGLPSNEVTTALNPADPYRFQIVPLPQGGLFQWANVDPVTNVRVQIPEGVVPQVWPLVVFAKLQDDPPGAVPHSADPGGLLTQGDKDNPAVIVQGITLYGDSLFNTVLNLPPGQPSTPTDHFTVLVRPSTICFDATSAATIAAGGVLVTPFAQAPSSDPKESPLVKDILPADILGRPGVKGLVRQVKFACMPKGRYAMNVVYPDSQAWTTPNEAGGCQGTEGTTVFGANPTDPLQNGCSSKPRHLLYSQATRAVLEIVDAADPANCQGPKAVPVECCPRGWSSNGGDCVPPGQ